MDEADQFVADALAEYEGQLIGYVAGILGDAEGARDVVQDTFIKLCKADHSKLQKGLKAWLYTVCRNRALDILRKDRRTFFVDTEILEQHREEGPDPSMVAERSEQGRNLMGLLHVLTENQQEVIRLRFQGDLSYKEISDVTGLTQGNVGFILHTGLKKLRELLGEKSA